MELYKKIDDLLDKYIKDNKIPHNRLSAYMEANTRSMDNFIKRNKLSEIENIESIITEQVSIKDKSVMTLDNFNEYIKEEFKFNKLSMCLYRGVEPPSIDYEKVLADHFDTNLSNITVIDKLRNLFEVSDWGINKFKAIIYHKDDFNIIEKNLVQYSFDKLSKMSIEIVKGVNIEMDKILDNESFTKHISTLVNEETVNSVISDSTSLDYVGTNGDYYIWSNKEK